MKTQSTPCTPSCRASSTTCSNLAVRLNRYRRPSHFVQRSAKHLRFGFYAFRKRFFLKTVCLMFCLFFFFELALISCSPFAGVPGSAHVRVVYHERHCCAGLCPHGAASGCTSCPWSASPWVRLTLCLAHVCRLQ